MLWELFGLVLQLLLLLLHILLLSCGTLLEDLVVVFLAWDSVQGCSLFFLLLLLLLHLFLYYFFFFLL